MDDLKKLSHKSSWFHDEYRSKYGRRNLKIEDRKLFNYEDDYVVDMSYYYHELSIINSIWGTDEA